LYSFLKVASKEMRLCSSSSTYRIGNFSVAIFY
jgi:hypothetical protein